MSVRKIMHGIRSMNGASFIARLLACLSVILCLLICLCTQQDRTYQFSPNTLRTRCLTTYYLRLIHLPVAQKVTQEYDYMLCSLWRSLNLLPEKNVSMQAQWITGLYCPAHAQGRRGPAYALLDVKQVGSPAYWKQFANNYPQEAKHLFRTVIAVLQNGDLDTAITLLIENAWLPIPA